MNYNNLDKKLINAFIRYQWNLENPMGFQYMDRVSYENTSIPPWEHQYRTDPVFRAKVKQLTAGVMMIVQDVEKEN